MLNGAVSVGGVDGVRVLQASFAVGVAALLLGSSQFYAWGVLLVLQVCYRSRTSAVVVLLLLALPLCYALVPSAQRVQ